MSQETILDGGDVFTSSSHVDTQLAAMFKSEAHDMKIEIGEEFLEIESPIYRQPATVAVNNLHMNFLTTGSARDGTATTIVSPAHEGSPAMYRY